MRAYHCNIFFFVAEIFDDDKDRDYDREDPEEDPQAIERQRNAEEQRKERFKQKEDEREKMRQQMRDKVSLGEDYFWFKYNLDTPSLTGPEFKPMTFRS